MDKIILKCTPVSMLEIKPPQKRVSHLNHTSNPIKSQEFIIFRNKDLYLSFQAWTSQITESSIEILNNHLVPCVVTSNEQCALETIP